ncbi:formimidoylglutamase [Riemerella anatipestifer]|uniref:formimidoylglutamase n=1 Tax=Riemerella anatipestifer TaxID=34085 RepID=UPI0012AE2234|nr:formimidoylglutamase [Riemerella anatipestifer]MDY3520159.1 formimidoylglutamase [Riemerella anatipestifer]MDY3532843.1 formimidoylglutamase [Riemerella anatipestifer]MDY3534602.1 formimidoylglutamase [Riemerella anatipestifer]USL96419.1 formimidoylglutamase [Riemerella anatipestifer]
MTIEEIVKPFPLGDYKPWQLGSLVCSEIKEGGVVLLFCSDDRGAGGSAVAKDFSAVRKCLYQLSKNDFGFPICDLGDLISGKSLEDTQYIVAEIVSKCIAEGALPIIIGGSNDLALSLYTAVKNHKEKISYTQINSFIHLEDVKESINERNFVSKILSEPSLKNYYHLGYQKHLNEPHSVSVLKEIDFEVLRLADMMNSTDLAEPFLRRAEVVSLSADAVESFSGEFSFHAQVNGLNKREICAYMKEIGLGENLRAFGLFNVNIEASHLIYNQLIAQMIWYFLEGLSIQKTHPRERQYENYLVVINNQDYTFKRDTFSGLWYFGNNNDILKCLPCAEKDYHNAKKGLLNPRFLK